MLNYKFWKLYQVYLALLKKKKKKYAYWFRIYFNMLQVGLHKLRLENYISEEINYKIKEEDTENSPGKVNGNTFEGDSLSNKFLNFLLKQEDDQKQKYYWILSHYLVSFIFKYNALAIIIKSFGCTNVFACNNIKNTIC